jgi:serine protease AprX
MLVVGAMVCAAALAAAAPSSAGTYDPSADPNSMESTTAYMGAQSWWGAGYTGQGIDVAVIDTGVAPVQGLDAPGKVVYGPDLSFESQAPNLTNLDTNGHGTFMAGLIAGNDGMSYRGIAPDARIVSLKVGSADGAVDVTQVIAAIDWVVQHAHDPGFNIRVLNLSYGTNSVQKPGVDPLSYAVEQAWKQGIVVVAAAGNTGYQRGTGAPGLADPAYNPYVIAAGATLASTRPGTQNDGVASFSASSTGAGGAKNPDFLTPGSHLQGLRVLGSYVDAHHPEGLIDSRFFRGSGTSQAAAVMSGAAALVLQRYPTLTPDGVKRYFANNAVKLGGYDSQAQGAGEIRLGIMLGQKPDTKYLQKFTAATGTGTIEGARGQDHITHDGVSLTGERDIFGKAIDPTGLAGLEASGSTWSGGTWNGSTWSGSTWSGSTWSGSTWSGSTWSGSTWSGSTWATGAWS